MKQSFNENWVCYRTGEKEKAFAVTLPHDAMQLDDIRDEIVDIQQTDEQFG